MQNDFELVRAVVVGAGSSSSTPMLRCALGPQPCPSCQDAVENRGSRNHRLNPSFLLQLRRSASHVGGRGRQGGGNDATTKTVNILIDCGKTFRESTLKVFAPLGVRDLHAVLITHAHADAVLGLDDLREFSTPCHPISVYTDVETQSYLQRVYGYLFPPPPAPTSTPTETPNKLWVASVDWKLYHAGERRSDDLLQSSILDVAMPTVSLRQRSAADQQAAIAEARRRAELCLPPAAELPHHYDETPSCAAPSWPIGVFHVWHGSNVASNSYVIPLPQESSSDVGGCQVLLYISDISELTAETVQTVRATIRSLHRRLSESSADLSDHDDNQQTDAEFLRTYVRILVLDMLGEAPYPSHLSVRAAVEAAHRIGAQQTFFVGMSHSLFYDAMPDRIKSLGGDPDRMQLAWDGCVVFEGGR